MRISRNNSSLNLVILNCMSGLETSVLNRPGPRIYNVSLKVLLVVIILNRRSRNRKISRIHKWSWSTLKGNCVDDSNMICACLRRLLLVKIGMMRSTSTAMRYRFCLLIYLGFLIVIYKNPSLSCCQLSRILILVSIVGSSRSWNHL